MDDRRSRIERKLDHMLGDGGPTRDYVAASMNRGEPIPSIAGRLAFLCGEKISPGALYKWRRRWLAEAREQEGRACAR